MTAAEVRPQAQPSAADRYTAESGLVAFNGMQALVRILLDRVRRDRARGQRTGVFVTGYGGSPIGSYDLELARNQPLLTEHDIVFRPALNEELAAMSVAGTQLLANHESERFDGVVGFWYGKAPGLDRATDALRHATYFGTSPRGGAVAIVGDDPAAKSSTVPSGSEAALADLMLPILVPADPQDLVDLAVHAVEMSRCSGLWSALRITTPVADGVCSVDVSPERVRPIGTPPESRLITGALLHPTLGVVERELFTTRIEAAREYSRANALNRVVLRGDRDRVGIITGGKTYLDVREALDTLGFTDESLRAAGVRIMRVSCPFPLHSEPIIDFARGLDRIIVVEEKRAFLETAVKDVLYDLPDRPSVHGKRTPEGADLFPAAGELTAEIVAEGLSRMLAREMSAVGAVRKGGAPIGLLEPLPIAATRVPYFCSGCPHSTSLVPSPTDSLTGAGIGCHTIAVIMDPRRVGELTGVTQMGGEGSPWIGMQPFSDATHFLQNLGDGTFHHSGSLAVRAAIAADVNITYRLLYNSAVAMTGGQTPVGQLSVAQIATLMLTEGVKRIIVTTDDVKRHRRTSLPRGVEVWDRSRVSEALEVLAGVPGVTMLIHEQVCAADGHALRAQDPNQPDQLQCRLPVPGGRLPRVHGRLPGRRTRSCAASRCGDPSRAAHGRDRRRLHDPHRRYRWHGRRHGVTDPRGGCHPRRSPRPLSRSDGAGAEGRHCRLGHRDVTRLSRALQPHQPRILRCSARL